MFEYVCRFACRVSVIRAGAPGRIAEGLYRSRRRLPLLLITWNSATGEMVAQKASCSPELNRMPAQSQTAVVICGAHVYRNMPRTICEYNDERPAPKVVQTLPCPRALATASNGIGLRVAVGWPLVHRQQAGADLVSDLDCPLYVNTGVNSSMPVETCMLSNASHSRVKWMLCLVQCASGGGSSRHLGLVAESTDPSRSIMTSHYVAKLDGLIQFPFLDFIQLGIAAQGDVFVRQF